MKSVNVLLLSIFLFQLLVGQWTVVSIDRHQQAVWHGDNSGQLITLQASNVQWINNHEVKCYGKLFDVVRKEGNVLYCSYDQDEEQMLAALDDTMQSNTADSKVAKVKISFAEYIVSASHTIVPYKSNYRFLNFDDNDFSAAIAPVAAPPPEFMS